MGLKLSLLSPNRSIVTHLVEPNVVIGTEARADDYNKRPDIDHANWNIGEPSAPGRGSWCLVEELVEDDRGKLPGGGVPLVV